VLVELVTAPAVADAVDEYPVASAVPVDVTPASVRCTVTDATCTVADAGASSAAASSGWNHHSADMC
jgi:hypothetical protein